MNLGAGREDIRSPLQAHPYVGRAKTGMIAVQSDILHRPSMPGVRLVNGVAPRDRGTERRVR
jgi:hypothetical protein